MSIFRCPRGLRTTLLGVAIVAGVVACQDNRASLLTAPRTAAADASATSAQGPTAAVALTTASAVLTQTGTTGWTLSKTGAVDATSKTVTWTITATKGTTTAGQLVVSGLLSVANTGTAGATIGNIVVLLQQKSGSNWVSKSADVADATHGDAATTANIDPKASSENLSTVTENAASGSLQFMDAHSNTLFSLQPEQTIAPNATVTLLFSARFDNTVLKLPVGQAVRAEVIVSFGHSTANKPSAQNVDINGNGAIDADEAWVRSVPVRLGLTVPAQQSDNGTLTIGDVASNITTTGDVTFSNPQFALGTTSGTVTVSYNGGANGGKITNCATGTGSGTTVTVGGFTFPADGTVGLQACNTQDIGATPACTDGAVGCGWSDGDMTTYDQFAWGASSTGAGSNLKTNFGSVYASTLGVVEVGIPGSTGFSMQFSSPPAVVDYLPAAGTAAALDADLLDPTTSHSGQFGGDVLALRLNIDFSDAGDLAGAVNAKFGDLTLCGFTTLTPLNGTSVRQFLGTANTLLGGGSSAYTISDIDPITVDLNNAFSAGTVSSFAQDHLVNGSCGWKTGDVVTYTQTGWKGGTLLTDANFTSIYGSDFEIGTEANFYTVFTTASALGTFLPQIGPIGVLDAVQVDPGATNAGALAGEVAALKLNIDFGDNALITGNAGVKLGDLRLCALSVSTLNNMTVRTFLSSANAVLGGLSGAASVSDTFDTANSINGSFSFGANTWAKTHLFNGACP